MNAILIGNHPNRTANTFSSTHEQSQAQKGRLKPPENSSHTMNRSPNESRLTEIANMSQSNLEEPQAEQDMISSRPPQLYQTMTVNQLQAGLGSFLQSVTSQDNTEGFILVKDMPTIKYVLQFEIQM